MRLTTVQHLFKRASLIIGLSLVAGMLIFFNLNRAFLYKELAILDLIPKPEKLTELYFNDPMHLPSSATSNQEISFTFVIHDVETIDYQYVYEVSVNANGAKHIVD